MSIKPWEKELSLALKKTLLDRESALGVLLFLARGNENGENNCKQMIEFLKTNPTFEEIHDKVDEILGIDIEDEE